MTFLHRSSDDQIILASFKHKPAKLPTPRSTPPAAPADPPQRVRAQRLRIGIQWNTQVTLSDAQHLVTQAYCSALPIAYSRHPADLWEPLARPVLEAAYEATLCAAILNGRRTGNRCGYLTLLGGGAFGNRTAWITDSVHHALRRYAKWNLDVAVVSYGTSKAYVRALAAVYRGKSRRALSGRLADLKP
jgi:hypothetical protein